MIPSLLDRSKVNLPGCKAIWEISFLIQILFLSILPFIVSTYLIVVNDVG